MARAGTKQTKIKRQLREGEAPGLNRHWRGIFLDFLAETSNVSEAARRAKINPSRAYKVRREEPEFARAWLHALWEGYTHLELEVLRRLRDGDSSGQDGTKYDFANAIRLLAAHRETVSQAQADQHNVSAAEVRASIDRKIAEIKRRTLGERHRGEKKLGEKLPS